MSEVKDAKPEGAAPAAAKGSKVLPILVGVNSLLLIAVLGFLGYQLTKKPHADEPAAAHADAEANPGDASEGEGHEKPVKAEKPAKAEKGEAKKEGHEAPKEGHEGAPAGKAVNGLGPMVKLADFVVHLRNPEVDRYARMSFDVEVFADPDYCRMQDADTLAISHGVLGDKLAGIAATAQALGLVGTASVVTAALPEPDEEHES